MDLDEYLAAHCSPEDDYLYRLYRATQTHLLRPRMASGHQQGVFLKMVARMVRPRLVLEIGTYSGYSALSLASGMPEGGRIITYEINDEQEDFTRPWLERAPYPVRIEMRIGDVLQRLPGDEEIKENTLDLVFIDANKRDYVAYYDLVFPLLKPGGTMLADNTLWDGHILDERYDRDAQTLGIRAFNDRVAADERIDKIILPLRDGLTLIRKK